MRSPGLSTPSPLMSRKTKLPTLEVAHRPKSMLKFVSASLSPSVTGSVPPARVMTGLKSAVPGPPGWLPSLFPFTSLSVSAGVPLVAR